MKKTLLAAVLLLLGSLSVTYAQPYRWIIPGTMSHRLDGSTNPQQEFTNLYRGHYYGYDVGGAMTNWGNSSQYKEFALFEHTRKAGFITQPSDVDVLPKKEWKRLLFNFRIAYPTAFDSTDTNSTEKYPVLLMMHGAGERADCWRGNCYRKTQSPRYYNNDHNVSHGGKAQIDAINRDPSDPRHWPGFVVVPQNKSGWNPRSYVPRIFALIEELAKTYPVDMNRIYVHGLSNGADASWMLLNERPDLFAAIAPMSGFANNGAYSYDVDPNEDAAIHVPIWQFQGGRDRNPRQSSTEQKMQQLRNIGGTPKYTLYPNLGHGTWGTAYNEPEFFSWFLQYSKLTIHSYYGVTTVCDGDPVDVKLGISPGFDDYEWQKMTATDTTAVTGIAGSPNEIIADEIASYRVRFARGTEWTEWSEPFTLTSKPRPTSTIIADASVALPGLDNRTELTLSSTNNSGLYYEWYKDDVLYLEDSLATSLTVTEAGKYHLVVTDQGLCKSFPSNEQFVSTLPYINAVPNVPTNVTATGTTPSSMDITWSDVSSDELGFDVYRSEDGVDFIWAGKTDSNITSFTDTGLAGSTQYQYAIRSFNANGASDPAALGFGTTLNDLDAPSTPSNFVVKGFNYTETKVKVNKKGYSDEHYQVHLTELVMSWSESTDNVGVAEYEIRKADGTVMATTSETNYILTGLNEDEVYTFYVVAKDLTGNESGQSNHESFTTTMNGLMFNLFAGGTWNEVKEFSDWGLFADGTFNNFSLNAINGLYQDGNPDPNYFAFEFFGYIYIEQAGDYTFATSSDDGSQLWIGSQEIVDNDFLHGATKVTSAPIFMDAGRHPITVKYFERTGHQNLNVYYRGNDTGGIEIKIPDSALTSTGSTSLLASPSVPSNVIETIGATIDTEVIFTEKLRVFPNPTQANNINIQGAINTESTSVNIQMIDMLGKVQYDANISTDQVLNGFEIKTNQSLHSGIYIIQINDPLGQRTQLRVIVK